MVASGAIGAKLDGLREGAKLTGATARDLRPIKALGRFVAAAGTVANFAALRDEGHSVEGSAGGALASTGTSLAFTLSFAAGGEAIFPLGGGIVGGAIGFGVDWASGASDKVGDGVANGIDTASGPEDPCSNCQAPMR